MDACGFRGAPAVRAPRRMRAASLTLVLTPARLSGRGDGHRRAARRALGETAASILVLSASDLDTTAGLGPRRRAAPGARLHALPPRRQPRREPHRAGRDPARPRRQRGQPRARPRGRRAPQRSLRRLDLLGPRPARGGSTGSRSCAAGARTSTASGALAGVVQVVRRTGHEVPRLDLEGSAGAGDCWRRLALNAEAGAEPGAHPRGRGGLLDLPGTSSSIRADARARGRSPLHRALPDRGGHRRVRDRNGGTRCSSAAAATRRAAATAPRCRTTQSEINRRASGSTCPMRRAALPVRATSPTGSTTRPSAPWLADRRHGAADQRPARALGRHRLLWPLDATPSGARRVVLGVDGRASRAGATRRCSPPRHRAGSRRRRAADRRSALFVEDSWRLGGRGVAHGGGAVRPVAQLRRPADGGRRHRRPCPTATSPPEPPRLAPLQARASLLAHRRRPTAPSGPRP